ncbi:MAG TPA: zinc ribbon domain-containing protein [Terriglobia bacterium]|nr:zinc ribbon domain-containing protein [Terriglobia bacterium]
MGGPFNDKLQAIRWRSEHERFRFSDEIRLIPRWYVTLIAVLYVLAMVIIQVANAAEPIFPEFRRDLGALAAAGITTAAAIGASLFLFLFCYIYMDARRRGMKAGLWLLLAIFVPDLIGVLIYFLMRDPLPLNCPQCGAVGNARYNYCPSCGQNYRPTCPQCKQEARPGDHYCPNCAYDLTTAKSASAGPPVTSPAPGAPA